MNKKIIENYSQRLFIKQLFVSLEKITTTKKNMTTTYSTQLCTKLIGTCLISTKHPYYGRNRMTTDQVSMSEPSYKNKLFKEIQSLEKRGIIVVTGNEFEVV